MNPCAVWDFRSNESDFTEITLKDWLKSNCKKWCFQLEQGDTGYRHWQGRFSLMKKRTKVVLMKLFNPVPNYLEPTLNENRDNNFYVLKEDTRIEGPYMDTPIVNSDYIPRQFRVQSLYPYQEKIIESRNDFDARLINVIYDPIGNKGKSTLAALIEIKYGGIDMPPVNDYKELIQLAYCVISSMSEKPKIMMFDMPRALNKEKLCGLYSAIEQIKKGKVYDLRYKYHSLWLDSPQIWVFTNVPPDMNFLSEDRWKVWQIDDNKMLVPYEEPPVNPEDF